MITRGCERFAEEDPDGFQKRREARWSGSIPEWYSYINKRIIAKFGDTKIEALKEQDLQARAGACRRCDLSADRIRPSAAGAGQGWFIAFPRSGSSRRRNVCLRKRIGGDTNGLSAVIYWHYIPGTVRSVKMPE
jgi:hypothetical protein